MARNLDPKCKQCRREGEKLFLKGDRCFTPKCPIVKRNYPPGQHGLNGKPRLSGYGIQLREKQKAKRTYRILEAQFSKYFEKASNKQGNTAELFIQSLETRLDNVVYRLALAQSRDQARQLIGHGHIQVNGQVVTIPSYAVRAGEKITLKEQARSKKIFENTGKQMENRKAPSWLAADPSSLSGEVVHLPAGDDLNIGIQSQLIVEYYSR